MQEPRGGRPALVAEILVHGRQTHGGRRGVVEADDGQVMGNVESTTTVRRLRCSTAVMIGSSRGTEKTISPSAVALCTAGPRGRRGTAFRAEHEFELLRVRGVEHASEELGGRRVAEGVGDRPAEDHRDGAGAATAQDAGGGSGPPKPSSAATWSTRSRSAGVTARAG